MKKKMKPTIIKNIPFNIRSEQLHPMLRIKKGGRYAPRLDRLLKAALEIAHPKAAYKLSVVEKSHDIDDKTVIIDGVKIESRIMRINLGESRRAFPFLVTCGTELEEWSKSLDDTLESFWADTINMLALGTALEAFKTHINKRFETGDTSTMNPGSLEDWPLSDQFKIFSILGKACAEIGVRLTKGALMKPLKSVSGLEFESGEKFYNCQLCPRANCSGRRSPYDEHLFAAKYKPESHRDKI
jgi:hypothetical protein